MTAAAPGSSGVLIQRLTHPAGSPLMTRACSRSARTLSSIATPFRRVACRGSQDLYRLEFGPKVASNQQSKGRERAMTSLIPPSAYTGAVLGLQTREGGRAAPAPPGPPSYIDLSNLLPNFGPG